MIKVIHCINMTLDGFCDHSAVIADDEHHRFVNKLMDKSDTLLLGANTFLLFESFWPHVGKTIPGDGLMLAFGDKINQVDKIVFSCSLSSTN